MKNIKFMILLMLPMALAVRAEEQSMPLSQAVKQAFGSAFGGATTAVAYAKKVDATDVTVFSLPFWFAHGLHGCKQRWNETHTWDTENWKFDRKPEVAKYRRFYNRLAAGDFSRFSWYHPIQSLKGNVIKCPPMVGPVLASVATGFGYHLATDFTYSKWYNTKGKNLK